MGAAKPLASMCVCSCSSEPSLVNYVIGTVNSEILARILFSEITVKDIFATFKIQELDMIYLHH